MVAVVPALLSATLLTLTPHTAHAQFATFTSFAAFSAALPVTGIDTFDDLTGVFIDTPLHRTAGPFQYTASTSTTDGFFRIPEPGNPNASWLSSVNADDMITFSAASPAVYGVGGNFFATDIDGNFLAGQTIRIVAATASSSFSMDLVGNPTTGFFGVRSLTGRFTSFSVSAIQTNSDQIPFPTVNNLTLGTVVPEPASVYLVAIGIAAMAMTAARRRRHGALVTARSSPRARPSDRRAGDDPSDGLPSAGAARRP
jgi:hypothetical protein